MVDFHRSLSAGDGLPALPQAPGLRRADRPRAPRPDLLRRLRPRDGARGRVRRPRPRRCRGSWASAGCRGRSEPTTPSVRGARDRRPPGARASGRSCCGGSSTSRAPRASPRWARTCGPTTRACAGRPRRSGFAFGPGPTEERHPGGDAPRLSLQSQGGSSAPGAGGASEGPGSGAPTRHRDRAAGRDGGRRDPLAGGRRGRDRQA